MFIEYPVHYEGVINSDEQISSLIDNVKRIHNADITPELFYSIIIHMRDGLSQPNQSNEFTIGGWVDFYANRSNPIIVTSDQLEVLFQYLQRFKINVIRFNGNEFCTVNFETRNFDTYFFIEMIILRAL
ncbi:hypothetical protein [Dokdonia sp.]|uniref:hypothetical protein n=1 Tax=Dokdonia sp. TaxID=2024995 RepID=UPI003264E88A